MKESDVDRMSDAEIRRELTRLRGIKAFWDEADRGSVQRMIAMLESAVLRRGKP